MKTQTVRVLGAFFNNFNKVESNKAFYKLSKNIKEHNLIDLYFQKKAFSNQITSNFRSINNIQIL